MKKHFDSIRKVLAPGDLIPILVIVFGLVIAITISEQAVRLIGASLTILGGVALFMLISQRLKNTVELRNKPGVPPPKFQITETQDSGAKRQIFEDYEDFAVEDITGKNQNSENAAKELSKEINSKINNTDLPASKSVNADDEGFSVVAKPRTQTGSKPNVTDKYSNASIDKHSENAEAVDEDSSQGSDLASDNYSLPENFSGMRIIGKVKKDAPAVQDAKPLPAQAPLSFADPDSPSEANKTNDDPRGKQPYSTPIKNDQSETPVPKPDFFAKSQKNIEQTVKSDTRTVQSIQLPESDPIASTIVKEKSSGFRELKIDIPLSTLMESEQQAGLEPRNELQYFLSRVLVIIRSVTNTRTAAFLFVNLEKKELILESYVSEMQDAITHQRKIPLGNDVVSQIILNVKPEILTDIEPSAELDLIPYYTRQVGISSFIGVPVFYGGTVIGILCADTAVADAYDAVTVNFFGHFARIIGSLVHSYTEKYDLLQASRTLDAITLFRNKSTSNDNTDTTICESIIEVTSSIMDYTSIGISTYDEKTDNWIIKSMKTKDKASEKTFRSQH